MRLIIGAKFQRMSTMNVTRAIWKINCTVLFTPNSLISKSATSASDSRNRKILIKKSTSQKSESKNQIRVSLNLAKPMNNLFKVVLKEDCRTKPKTNIQIVVNLGFKPSSYLNQGGACIKMRKAASGTARVRPNEVTTEKVLSCIYCFNNQSKSNTLFKLY